MRFAVTLRQNLSAFLAVRKNLLKASLIFLICAAFSGTMLYQIIDAKAAKSGEQEMSASFAPTPPPTPFCTPNSGPPSAGDDIFFWAWPAFAFQQTAPGVLGNDSDGEGVTTNGIVIKGVAGAPPGPYTGPYFVDVSTTAGIFISTDSYGTFTYADPSGQHAPFHPASLIYPTHDRAIYEARDNFPVGLTCPYLTSTAQIDIIYFPQFAGEGIGRPMMCPDKPDPNGKGGAPMPGGVPPMFGESPRQATNAVGGPVNITNGNVFLDQTDYVQRNRGSDLSIVRSFNSQSQVNGIFGYGWSTMFDERIETFSQTSTNGLGTDMDGAFVARVIQADGRPAYFTRATTSSTTYQTISAGFYGTLTTSAGAYTLTYKDGSVHQFNDHGRLTSITDRNGNAISLTYDTDDETLLSVTNEFGKTLIFDRSVSNQITVSDDLGEIATYNIDSGDDTLTSVEFPDGSEYNFTYTVDINTAVTPNLKFALLTEVTDALGHILEKHAYSGLKATTSEEDSGVNKYTIAYDSNTQTTVTDALGNETVYTIALIGSRRVVTRIEGDCGCGGGASTQNWEYDSKLNVTEYSDGNGHEKDYTYDGDGDLLTRVDDTGTVTYTYNAYGQVLTRTDQMSGVMTIAYDGNGNIDSVTDPLSNVREFEYNGYGQVIESEDARDKVTTFEWTDGNLTSIIDPLSNETNFTYDNRSRLDTITNELSHVTDLDYDLNNRLKKVIFPDTNYVQYTYDTGGRKTVYRDPRGKTTTYSYDDSNRLTSAADPLSHAKTFGYDLMSNLTSVTDANSNSMSFEYDDLNRLKKIVYPIYFHGAYLNESFTYDDAGNVTSHTDSDFHTTSYEYDNVNRVITVTDALSNETNFEYNARSQRTKITDALSQEYDFTYDPLGRKLTQTRNGTTETWEYDENGNRTSRTDHNGLETTYTYDDLNRLTDIAYDGSSNFVIYGYDELSRMISAENQKGTVTFGYDNRNRVSSTTDVLGHTVEYTYDENGNRTAMSLDSNPYTSYEYDDASRLAQLTNETNSEVYGFGYDAGNRLTSKTLPNGVETEYTYDSVNQLTHLTHKYGSTNLIDNSYAYDIGFNLNQIDDGSVVRPFAYDELHRQVYAANGGPTSESYSYDGVGNRLTAFDPNNLYNLFDYDYDPFNRLDNIEHGNQYMFDDNGNLTTYELPALHSPFPLDRNYSWDEENRLTQMTITGSTSVSVPTLNYEYDALGRRVRRIYSDDNGTTETAFAYDGMDVVQDDNITDSNVTTYQNGAGIDNKLSITDSKGEKYFLQDHIGSTVGLSDSGGTMPDSQSYDSFGIPNNNSFPTRYQFTGRELDDASGFYHYRARQYDPQIGRFISEDPIGFKGGDLNLYAYVGNNPGLRTDPTGLDYLIYQNQQLTWVYESQPYIIDSGGMLNVEPPHEIGRKSWGANSGCNAGCPASGSYYPIPPGTYTTAPEDRTDHTGLEGPWGPFSYRLHEGLITRLFNRWAGRTGGFHIHGGLETGTAGCIEFANYDPEQNWLKEFDVGMQAYGQEITLYVR